MVLPGADSHAMRVGGDVDLRPVPEAHEHGQHGAPAEQLQRGHGHVLQNFGLAGRVQLLHEGHVDQVEEVEQSHPGDARQKVNPAQHEGERLGTGVGGHDEQSDRMDAYMTPEARVDGALCRCDVNGGCSIVSGGWLSLCGNRDNSVFDAGASVGQCGATTGRKPGAPVLEQCSLKCGKQRRIVQILYPSALRTSVQSFSRGARCRFIPILAAVRAAPRVSSESTD